MSASNNPAAPVPAAPVPAAEGHALSPPVPPTAAAAAAPAPAAFKFGRMFAGIKDTTQGEAADLKVKALIELGTIMDEPPPGDPAAESRNSSIPAGYTYLGQFIAHEITNDGQGQEVFTAELNPADVPQCCSPTLDLDCLYGAKPDVEKDRLYESDNVRMKVGETSVSPHWAFTPAFDLPRAKVEGKPAAQAQIGDPRNDENLPVAQTHVAFIKFHNKVAGELDAEKAANGGGRASFEEVREQVVRHFQWIVLRDYLPRVIDAAVLRQVVSDMRAGGGQTKFFRPEPGGGLYMPVEFSAAAYRFGHSMVRSSYEWNYFHRSGSHLRRATLDELFRQTGFSGALGGEDKLRSEWIIDWKRFYAFPPLDPGPNMAKKIDTTFDFRLGDILGFPHPQGGAHAPELLKRFRPLPVRNLLRGFALRLPSGQAVAGALGLDESERLTEADIASDGPHAAVLKAHGFDKETPLWYYVLKEAETKGGGDRLGPVGSRLVAETFVGIVRNSEFSILDPADEAKDWRPRFGKRAPDAFDMADMLEFTGIVTPIGLSK